MTIKDLIKNEFVILDGAMGTMLQKSGLKLGDIPETLNITNPEVVIDIHKQYVKAGSNIISANTFGANGYKLKNSGYTVSEIVRAGVSNARKATEGKALVALDIGPIGQLLEPAGTLSFDDAYNYYKEVILAGEDADLIFFETMTDLLELKAGVLAAKENSDKFIMTSMTFEQNQRTFAGVSVEAFAVTMEALGVDVIGVNCSLGPKEIYPIMQRLIASTSLPLLIKPNAGLPDPNSNTYDVNENQFASGVFACADLGRVKFVGGCCGTTPVYIARLKDTFKNIKYEDSPLMLDTCVCSGTKLVEINEPRVIGERINPTGKKRFKEALINNDIDFIIKQAVEQVNAGADILDVNVGLPEINEKEMMVKVVKALQSVVDVPLQIDSTKPDVIEAALRIYNGKAIVNSVNGEEESLKSILPIVKKYGASVVGLTLDKNGIPKTAEGRFEIAQKIVKTAESYGIPAKDVYIDCLTLTVSAQQEGCKETLKALNTVKTQLGCKTCLGVSNISFGLPKRELVNHIFLAMALEEGLDLPIINPNDSDMMGTIRAYKVLANIDKNSRQYIDSYNDSQVKVQETVTTQTTLVSAIATGLKNEAMTLTEKILEDTDSMIIVNDHLIPALDMVGEEFEKGNLFLPQLIQSASAAQGCFEIIRQNISTNDSKSVSKGKIILATVKGDIHDIGKNIVKVLLDNYGYTVIDLGKDVDPQLVVDTAIKQDVKMIGLSALMTTTLASMQETISLIRSNDKLKDAVVMVGGAVLTEEYAMQIGADYYCKDAKEGVNVAKKVFG